MSAKSYDLVVVGAGPGGYVGAIRAAQLGLKVAIIEKRGHLGGTCLNVGCIPTKALLESAKTYTKLQHIEDLGFDVGGEATYNWDRIMGRKTKIVDEQRKGLRFLMKKNKIDTYDGFGQIAGKNKVTVTENNGGKKVELTAKNVMIATGSKIRTLPFAPTDDKVVLNSDSILDMMSVPKSLCVVGGGVIGTEFASLFGRFGTEVTIIELGPQIIPTEDEEVIKELTKHLKKQNIKIETNTKLTKVEAQSDHALVTTEGSEPRKFEKVLISVGRAPVTEDIGLETAGIKLEKSGFLPVNEHYQTSAPWVWAIGDVINTPMLAHTASAEAIHAAEVIAGHTVNPINYDANPNAIYCYPEVASIGKTEKTLKEQGVEYKTAKFPFAPMAKAKIEGAAEGFIKIIFEPKYKEILGVHIVGARATELIAEFVLGKVLETTVDEIGLAIHPHPTISETVMEAAHTAIGGAIHM